MSIYTIMGITGQVGGATARALLRKGKKVRGIVRSRARGAVWEKEGVELAVADYTDEDALRKAFEGSDGVFAMVPANFAPSPGYSETRTIAATMRRALEDAQPGNVVALSSVGAHHKSGLGLITQCHILEQEIQPLAGLSIPVALLRAAWFLDNFQWDIPSAQSVGEIASFLIPADKKYPMVAAADIGKLAAATLQEKWTGIRKLELEGPERYSQLDAARAFSELLNRSIALKPVPRAEWQALFESQGMPADRTAPRLEMLDGFNSGWIDFEQPEHMHFKGETTQLEALRNLLNQC
jgi:uncharacterized protein YbjT (DUF2867 family)